MKQFNVRLVYNGKDTKGPYMVTTLDWIS
jgi:hypothetical protein